MGGRDDELIARVHRAFEAFNRRDYDAAMALVHPDIVFVRQGAQSTITGADGIRSWMEPDAFESQVIEPCELEVAGNKVFIRSHSKNKGAGSGIEMELDALSVWTFDQDGRVIKIEAFLAHEEAEARSALQN